MKDLIKKSLLFIFLLLIPIVVLIVIIKSNSREIIPKLERYSNFSTLIMGDSQMQRINPEGFENKKTGNFASSGEHYYFTYQKLKFLTGNKNSNLEQIIIGVSPHNFAPIYSKLFDPSTAQGANSIERYYYFINDNDFVNLLDVLKFKHLRNIVIANPDWGGFYKSNKSKLDTVTINRVFKMHFEGMSKDFSQSQEKYLGKIVELCLLEKIDLTFVATPYHPFYKSKIDNYYLTRYYAVINKYQSANYLNFMNDSINLEWMSDGNHLSLKGSSVYSKKISDAIGSPKER
jgi:hypothetical protein